MARGTAASAAAAVLVGAALLLAPGTLSSHTPITTTIVFQKEIAQIFQRKCLQCHTEENLAMSLTTYSRARPWAVAIKEEVLERRMPPWSAVSGYGHFANDMSLTSREVSLLLAWADGGAPSGVLKVDEDKPPVFVPPLHGWERGAPDAVVRVGAGHHVAAHAGDETVRLEIATGLAAPRWLRALQLDPADRRVLRYAAYYESGTGRWLGTWTPTHQVSSLPDGVALLLPAQSRLTVELGYRGTDERASGEGALGLYFAQRPETPATPFEMAAAPTDVAGRTVGQRVRAETTLKAPTVASALWPRPGAGGRSVELTAVLPDGVVQPLMWLKDYRADWPSAYVFREPVTLPAGTRLVLTAYYDNEGAAPLQARPRVDIGAFTPSLRTATP